MPETGKDYPLPPTFGRFPIAELESDADQREFAIPVRRREALWIAFEGPHSCPSAVKVGVGTVNAIDGRPWETGLRIDPQNYIVTATQYWLDGINAGKNFVRQFVAIAFGEGLTIEEQAARVLQGTIRLEVFAARPGRFAAAPEQEPSEPTYGPAEEAPLGLGAGGRIQQKIHADRYGLDTWDQTNPTLAVVRLLDAASFQSLTGRAAPPSPIDAATYACLGLPWFELYEEQATDLQPAEIFRHIRTVSSSESESDLEALRVRRVPN
ncbi:hypothetical protein [Bradyrhizobium sp. LMTR 3]|uniref:hypothetical protein n=1 Tax=Bradyrhizobium sp. LMTR 3 TaxID=189873 RepID=UPI0011469F45|nr:hypothetical protein [Bradyrhizobium sp. LMTR 3]